MVSLLVGFGRALSGDGIPSSPSSSFAASFSSTTDNFAFRLQTKVTGGLFFVLGVIVLVHASFTDVMDCVSGDNNVPWGMLDAICYVQGTFSIASAWKKEIGNEVPYPGIDNYNQGEERVYHGYYKWVGWTLCLQGILFLLPALFWCSFEKGNIARILRRLRLDKQQSAASSSSLSLLDTSNKDKEGEEAFAFLRPARKTVNLAGLSMFVFLELLSTMNLIVQILLLNALLGGGFFSYGWLAVFSSFRASNEPDIQAMIFPYHAKCTYLRFTSSGDIQRLDSTCVLTSNFLYAKIYLALWFWLLAALLVGFIALVLRIVVLAVPKARAFSTEPSSGGVTARGSFLAV